MFRNKKVSYGYVVSKVILEAFICEQASTFETVEIKTRKKYGESVQNQKISFLRLILTLMLQCIYIQIR